MKVFSHHSPSEIPWCILHFRFDKSPQRKQMSPVVSAFAKGQHLPEVQQVHAPERPHAALPHHRRVPRPGLDTADVPEAGLQEGTTPWKDTTGGIHKETSHITSKKSQCFTMQWFIANKSVTAMVVHSNHNNIECAARICILANV